MAGENYVHLSHHRYQLALTGDDIFRDFHVSRRVNGAMAPAPVIHNRDSDFHAVFQGTQLLEAFRGLVAIVELRSIEYSLVDLPTLLNETVLRVGPLELDLLDRTAKRGDRQIDLRPREFQLLKYMMQQSDKSLTRATLLKEVWRYRVVPETNLVDVHMGKLRRKVDGPNEAPMICNVRGVGFVLSEALCSQSSPSKADERSRNLVVADKSPQSVEQAVQ